MARKKDEIAARKLQSRSQPGAPWILHLDGLPLFWYTTDAADDFTPAGLPTGVLNVRWHSQTRIRQYGDIRQRVRGVKNTRRDRAASVDKSATLLTSPRSYSSSSALQKLLDAKRKVS